MQALNSALQSLRQARVANDSHAIAIHRSRVLEMAHGAGMLERQLAPLRRYHTAIDPDWCDCPDWWYRRRKDRGRCKHQSNMEVLMPLTKIPIAESSVSTIMTTIYGDAGVGKTTLAATASRPLILDFDRGVHRSVPIPGAVVVPVATWQDIAHIAAADLAGHDTIVVDTLGAAVMLCQADVVSQDRRLQSDAQILRRYGAVKRQMALWLTGLRSHGLDVIIVSHAVEVREDDQTVYRMDAEGSTKRSVVQMSDIVGRIHMRGDDRWLQLRPVGATLAKGPRGLDDCQITDGDATAMADLIAEAKALFGLDPILDRAAEALRLQDAATARGLLDTASAHPQAATRRHRIDRGYEALPTDAASGGQATAAEPPAPTAEPDTVICVQCGDHVDAGQTNDAGMCGLCAPTSHQAEAPPAAEMMF